MTTAIAFDYETYPIAPGVPHPPPVCMSFAIIENLQIVQSGVLQWREGNALLQHALRNGWRLVGANTAFDVFVHALSSDDVESAVHEWIDAYEQARVEDVLLRQKLLDGAVDKEHRLHGHRLKYVTKHWTGVDLTKGDDSWQKRFGELDGLPVEQYPREAYDYALADAWFTAVVWIWQEHARNGVVCEANGVNYREVFHGIDILIDQHRQAMKAFAIADLSAAGLRANPDSVAKLKANLVKEKESLLKVLVPYGLVRRDVSLNYAGIAARMRAIGVEPTLLKSGKPSLSRAVYQQIAEKGAAGYALLKTHRDYGWPDTAAHLADNYPDLVNVEYVRCEDVVRTAVALLYDLRVSYCNARGEFIEVPEGEEPKRSEKKVFDPKTRRPVVEYGAVTIDADNCDRTGHPALAAFARYSSIIKTLGNDIPLLEKASREPFHAHYNTLKDNGRTATGSDGGEGNAGNVQNLPRAPGVRECYEAPEGWAFCAVDYAAVELSTFGQVCLWWLGWSECARMIQQKIDQHAVMGAALLNLEDPRDAGWKYVKENKSDPRCADARTGGKGMNFGCKAKMSAKRYKDYAWNSYGLKLTLEEAQRHIDLHNEMIAEMSAYTQKVTSFVRGEGGFGACYDLVHPWSGRVRAGLRFTDVHNYPFSGLAQDMAAVAAWDLFKAKWGKSGLGKEDPFYGCFPCLFTHDEIVAYVPADRVRGNAAAQRQAEIMRNAAWKVLPDVGSDAQPSLQKQLSKKADDAPKEIQKGADGLLNIWDVWVACEHDLHNPRRPNDASDRAWLTKQKWPTYVIDDVLSEKEKHQ